MTTNGLSDNVINKITGVFKSYYQVEKVVLYGSRAKGTYKNGSDIDLTMFGDELSDNLLLEIADKLDELLLPYMIDLSIFNHLNNDKLKDHITRVGVVFYERKQVLKQGWEIKKLGDVCDLQNGCAFKSNDYIEFSNTVNFRMSQIRPGGGIDLENNLKYLPDSFAIKYKDYLLREGDVVVAMTDMATETKILGVPTIIPQDNRNWLLNQRVGKLCNIDKTEIDLVYLKYILNSTSINNYYKSLGRGGLQVNIGKQDILNALIPRPPLPEQQKIVAILDKAFSTIDQAKQHAEQNLKNAKELFNSYLQSVFNNEGDDWEVEKLGEVCEFKSGTTIPVNLERDAGDILYIKIAEMNLLENLIEINTSTRFVNSHEIKLNQIIPEGAIIFPKRGGAIATNKKRKIIKPTIVDLNTMAIIPSKRINKDFLYFWFQQIDLNKISNGTSIPQINNYSFDNIYLSYPTTQPEQQAIVKKLDALSTETMKLEAIYQQKLTKLEELKKSILQKAFNGELT